MQRFLPSLKLNYFDKATQTKKTISTQPINIQVDKASPVIAATTETLVKPDNKTPVNNKLKYYYLLLGLVIGALISFLSIKLNNRQKPEKNQDLIKQIKSSKGYKALFESGFLMIIHIYAKVSNSKFKIFLLRKSSKTYSEVA
jgi:hypothetical protein